MSHFLRLFLGITNKEGELINIGSKVNIDLERIQDRIPERLAKIISQDSTATVIDYKMTDGTDIGFILKLSNGNINWFFKKELSPIDGNSSSDIIVQRKGLVKKRTKYVNPSQNIFFALNPINFYQWTLASLKDLI